MKYYVAIVVLCCTFCFSTKNISAKSGSDSAERVLKKVAARLSNLRNVSFTFESENNAQSIGLYKKKRIESFLDFTSTDKSVGVRYQFDDPDYVYIFNGSEYFVLNKMLKTYSVKKDPNFHDFESVPGLAASLVTLKNSLPEILSDETIRKTVSQQSVGKRKVYVVDLVLDSKIMTLSGDFFSTTPGIKFTYRLTIDNATDLPLEIFRTNDSNSNSERSTFLYKPAKFPLPTETSWYYSSYAKDYKPEQPYIDRKIEAGQDAPDWKLSSVKNDASVSLSQYKGKIVLVEFWISFCGYCIKAVPALNVIEEKYRNKDFKLLAVNYNDALEVIQKFEKNSQPKYEILHGGRETAEKYGVDGFPTVFLIDRTGKIIYSGDGVDKALLDDLIAKSLEQ